MNEFDPWVELIRLVGAGIVGGLISAFVAHKLTISRERMSGQASRKREFLVFMKSWRVEIDRQYLESGGFVRNAASFTDMVSSYCGMAESIRKDFRGTERNQFDALHAAMTRCGAQNFNHGEQQRSQMLKAFGDLISFVNSCS
jgi:hypothetical protein